MRVCMHCGKEVNKAEHYDRAGMLTNEIPWVERSVYHSLAAETRTLHHGFPFLSALHALVTLITLDGLAVL